MQYMLPIYLDEKSLTEAQRTQCYEDSAAYAQQLRIAGNCFAVAPLQPTSTPNRERRPQKERFPGTRSVSDAN